MTRTKKCTNCGGINFDDFFGHDICSDCHQCQIKGCDPGQTYDFKSYGDDADNLNYIIAGISIPKQLIDKYLLWRRTSGSDRVYYHKKIFEAAGAVYTNEDGRTNVLRKSNWADYFEKWIESYLDTKEGQSAQFEASKFNCKKCGLEMHLGVLHYSGPGGPLCIPCHKETRR